MIPTLLTDEDMAAAVEAMARVLDPLASDDSVCGSMYLREARRKADAALTAALPIIERGRRHTYLDAMRKALMRSGLGRAEVIVADDAISAAFVALATEAAP